MRYATTGEAYCVSDVEALLLFRFDRPKPRPNARAAATAKTTALQIAMRGLRVRIFDFVDEEVVVLESRIGLLFANTLFEDIGVRGGNDL